LRDELPLNEDRDGDGRIQVLDECDNSRLGAKVDAFGCEWRVTPHFGYLRVVVADMPIIEELVEFLFDKTELTDESKAIMRSIIERLHDVDGYVIEIQAHTDSMGGDAYNQRLSQRRADALREMLDEAGIGMDRTVAIGMGSNYPIAENNTVEGRARNRRAEFHLQQNEGSEQ
jgi:OOP family OmpA-OmpF porin